MARNSYESKFHRMNFEMKIFCLILLWLEKIQCSVLRPQDMAMGYDYNVMKFKRDTEYTRRNDEILPKPGVCGPTYPIGTIIGGEEAGLGEIPWLVNLEYNVNNTLVTPCSGSIINQRYVLTAAHCLADETYRAYGEVKFIKAGDHNLNTVTDCDKEGCLEPFQRIEVVKRILHPNYSRDALNRPTHDIALLRLSRDLEYSRGVRPICLPDAVASLKPLSANSMLTVAGWGQTRTAYSSPTKQKVKLPYVPYDDCDLYLYRDQFCAGGEEGKDACKGDSGGSVTRLTKDGYFLVGIVSYGRKCGKNQPSVYTSVDYHMDWIHNNIEA